MSAPAPIRIGTLRLDTTVLDDPEKRLYHGSVRTYAMHAFVEEFQSLLTAYYKTTHNVNRVLSPGAKAEVHKLMRMSCNRVSGPASMNGSMLFLFVLRLMESKRELFPRGISVPNVLRQARVTVAQEWAPPTETWARDIDAWLAEADQLERCRSLEEAKERGLLKAEMWSGFRQPVQFFAPRLKALDYARKESEYLWFFEFHRDLPKPNLLLIDDPDTIRAFLQPGMPFSSAAAIDLGFLQFHAEVPDAATWVRGLIATFSATELAVPKLTDTDLLVQWSPNWVQRASADPLQAVKQVHREERQLWQALVKYHGLTSTQGTSLDALHAELAARLPVNAPGAAIMERGIQVARREAEQRMYIAAVLRAMGILSRAFPHTPLLQQLLVDLQRDIPPPASDFDPGCVAPKYEAWSRYFTLRLDSPQGLWRFQFHLALGGFKKWRTSTYLADAVLVPLLLQSQIWKDGGYQGWSCPSMSEIMLVHPETMGYSRKLDDVFKYNYMDAELNPLGSRERSLQEFGLANRMARPTVSRLDDWMMEQVEKSIKGPFKDPVLNHMARELRAVGKRIF